MKKDFQFIKLSQDRKIQEIKGERNSFALPVFLTCPGKTESCKAVCYANRGMFSYKNAKKMYQNNYNALRTILLKMPVNEATKIFQEEIRKHNKSGIFRWNISGDIFSKEYFRLICNISAKTPEIKFWLYTRSFEEILSAKWTIPGNLKIILSLDKDNVKKIGYPEGPILPVFRNNYIQSKISNKLISWMGDIEDAKKAFPYRKWFTCPELTKKIDLQGACAKCRLCFEHPKESKFGVHFPTKKKEGRV